MQKGREGCGEGSRGGGRHAQKAMAINLGILANSVCLRGTRVMEYPKLYLRIYVFFRIYSMWP